MVDPFSVPAQMNNLGVFIVACVIRRVYQDSPCQD